MKKLILILILLTGCNPIVSVHNYSGKASAYAPYVQLDRSNTKIYLTFCQKNLGCSLIFDAKPLLHNNTSYTFGATLVCEYKMNDTVFHTKYKKVRLPSHSTTLIQVSYAVNILRRTKATIACWLKEVKYEKTTN